MTDREKLIEVYAEAKDKNREICNIFSDCEGCAYEDVTNCHDAIIVDNLIANGVTFQQWIPAAERLPEENAVYMVSAFDGHDRRVTFAQWQNRIKRWYLTGSRSYWKVTHWMPLPEPPEE